MRAVLQRVERAAVSVDGKAVGEINKGLLILLGVMKGDSGEDAELLSKKCAELRIFEDNNGKMNLPLKDIGGKALVISQFTLAANCKKGRRPSFDEAARPEDAIKLYEAFCEGCQNEGIAVQKGQFAAHMKVELINDGPVTIILDSRDIKRGGVRT